MVDDLSPPPSYVGCVGRGAQTRHDLPLCKRVRYLLASTVEGGFLPVKWRRRPTVRPCRLKYIAHHGTTRTTSAELSSVPVAGPDLAPSLQVTGVTPVMYLDALPNGPHC